MNKEQKVLWIPVAIMSVVLMGVLTGCASFKLAPEPVTKAVAVIRPIEGSNAAGIVTFIQEGNKVRIVAEISGLSPGKHGFHIHENGDMTSADGMSLGGHYNPYNSPHAGPDKKKRHLGDLGNIEADKNGKAKYNRLDDRIALRGANSIIGRSIVIKERADDLETQPGGNAGKRIAYGIIGAASMEAD